MDEFTRVCDYCKRAVSALDGIVEMKVWYHPHCYNSVIGKRIKKLSSKIDSGQITAQEAAEYDNLVQIIKTDHTEITNKKNINSIQSNRVVFGKRTDTKSFLESGEMNEYTDKNRHGKKVLMPGIYAIPEKNIIPYKQQKQITDGSVSNDTV